MGLTTTTSTTGKFVSFSSEATTSETVFTEVLDELDEQNKPLTKTNFVFSHDGTSYVLAAIVKN